MEEIDLEVTASFTIASDFLFPEISTWDGTYMKFILFLMTRYVLW